MTIRLTCDVTDTKVLLRDILTHTIQGKRVMFLCEPGTGGPTIQRVRVALSRWRTRRKTRNMKVRRFTLHNTIHPHTEDAKRYDAVVVWESQHLNHSMLESLDDLIGNGDSL